MVSSKCKTARHDHRSSTQNVVQNNLQGIQFMPSDLLQACIEEEMVKQ